MGLHNALQSSRSNLKVEGKVINVQRSRDEKGHRDLVATVEGDEKVYKNVIDVRFRKEWADACVTLEEGDEVAVENFTIETTHLLNKPFEVLVTDCSEVVIRRVETKRITAANVDTAHFNGTQQHKEPHNPASIVACAHNQFSKIGRHYDTIHGNRHLTDAVSFMLSIITREGRWNVLDLGCGTGLYLFFLRYYGLKMTGVDISTELLDIAREKLRFQLETEPSCKYETVLLQGEATGFEVKKDEEKEDEGKEGWKGYESFDCALCIDVLEYMPGLEEVRLALRRLWYHLEEGGLLIANVPNVHIIKSEHTQNYRRIPIEKRAVISSIGTDEGILDYITRTFAPTADGTYKVHHNGHAVQATDTGSRYFTSFEETTTHLMISGSAFESILKEERFVVEAMYGDMVGGEYQPRVSKTRLYILKRH